ncbi:MAG: hypothetical protein JW894_11330 [Bacteroidales bacterium]|nr:hypothetical protein [Bacteroidales bacterium]
MRRIFKYLPILLIFLVFVNCKPKVLFKKAQPKRIKNLHYLPAEYLGKYLNVKDSSVLTIDSIIILHEEFEFSKMTRQELYEDIDTVINHDTTVYIDENWVIAIRIFGDSASYSSYMVDTLFNLDNNDVLRKYEGYLFLNKLSDNELWEISIMKLTSDSLLFDPLVRSSEIDSLRSITRIREIKDPEEENKIKEYHLNPTRKQLRKILEKHPVEYSYLPVK